MTQLCLFTPTDPATLTDLQQRIISAIRSGHRRFGDLRRAALGEQANDHAPFLQELRALEDNGQVITRRHYPGGTGYIKEYEVTQ